MVSLNSEQIYIYNDLFNVHARQAIRLQSATGKFNQDSISVFGHNIFLHFLKKIESRGGNICAYLENIILYTKFLTYLVLRDEKDGSFDKFYRNVTEFCLKIIKFLYPENEINSIYTKDFDAFLKDTIFFSLKPTPGELQRIQNIFVTKASIISCNKTIESFDAILRVVQSSKTRIPRELPPAIPPSKYIVPAINSFINNLCDQLNDIVELNPVNDANLIRATRTRLLQLGHKHGAHTANYSRYLSTKRYLPMSLTLLLVIAASRTTGYMESNVSYALFMALVIFILGNIIFDTIKSIENPLGALEKTKLELAEHERNLEDCFSLESQEYTGEQKHISKKENIDKKEGCQECAMRVYTFVSLPQLEQKKKEHSAHLPPKQKESSKIDPVDEKPKKIPSEKLPPYYQRDSSRRLVLFNPAEVKSLDKDKNPQMDPTKFSQSTYNIFPIKSSSKRKWREGKKEVDFKLKLQGRDRARCYGIEKMHEINGKKEVVCHVLYYKSKTH